MSDHSIPSLCKLQSSYPEVEFRFVPWNKFYVVGDNGTFWSCRGRGGVIDGTWRQMNPCSRNKYGHKTISLRSGKRLRPWSAHVLILTVFFGRRPNGMECCHGDGNPANNSLSNLRWDTHAANVADKIKHGTNPAGTKNAEAKITDADVNEIRKRCANGERQVDVGADYGLVQQQVSNIVRRQSWKHV